MRQRFESILRNPLLRNIVVASVMVFPILTNLVKHAGSTFLVTLAALGLPVMWSSRFRPLLNRHEKWVMWTFAVYFIVYLLSFVINGLLGYLADPRMRDLGHEFRFLLIFPIFMLFRHVKLTQTALWTGILAGAFLSGVYAILSYLWISPGERVAGSYHAIAFGDLALVLAFSSIPAFTCIPSKPKRLRLIPLAAFVSGMIGSILSQTRGAWIAIPALTIILFFYSAPMLRIAHRLCLLMGISILIFGAYLIPATEIAGRMDAVLTEAVNYWSGDKTYTSVATRIEGWRVALEIFRDNPAIGAGPGNYEPLLNRMIEQGKPYTIAAVHSQPHGAYPLTMADCGLAGLLALLGLFASPIGAAFVFIRLRKQVRHLGYALMILVVGFMHFGLTETIFSLNINLTFYIIITAAIMAVAANEGEKRPSA